MSVPNQRNFSDSANANCVIPENIHTPTPPPPPQQMVLSIRPPPHPLGISVPEGSYITSHHPSLPHLEIIDRVPFKINCSHLTTQFFIILDQFVIFYKAICISYASTARLIDYQQSVYIISLSSEMREARKQRLISSCHLKKTIRT